MSLPACRIGDADFAHCSGMTRAQGSQNVEVNGRPWSLMTHLNTPHLKPCGKECCTHSQAIAEGSDSVIVNGLGAGRIFDAIINCTAVAQGSDNVEAGDTSGTRWVGPVPPPVPVLLSTDPMRQFFYEHRHKGLDRFERPVVAP